MKAGLAAILAVLLAVPVLGATVAIAPPGSLPAEALRLEDMTLVPPSTIDSLGFYQGEDGVRMVSQLYPLATQGCARKEGQRSLPARVGTYCFLTDTATYVFTIDRIDGASVDVNLTRAIAGDAMMPIADAEGQPCPQQPPMATPTVLGLPLLGVVMICIGLTTCTGVLAYLLLLRP